MATGEPPPRYGHAAVRVAMKQFVWGGEMPSMRSSGKSKFPTASVQVETFDVPSLKWKTPLPLEGSLPNHLLDMAIAADGESVYSFGGWNGRNRINTVYEINTRSLECRELRPASTSDTVPKGRIGSRSVFFQKMLVVFGGYTNEGATNDLYVFDLRSSEFEIETILMTACTS